VVFSGSLHQQKKTKKNDHHDIAEILLKVVLTTITLILTPKLVYVGHKTQIGDKTKKTQKKPTTVEISINPGL